MALLRPAVAMFKRLSPGKIEIRNGKGDSYYYNPTGMTRSAGRFAEEKERAEANRCPLQLNRANAVELRVKASVR